MNPNWILVAHLLLDLQTMSKILVIEDNLDIRENIQEILELAGYETFGAANGKEGVRHAVEHIPDLILCDIMMPELDGYGVLHILSKKDETLGIPFKTRKEAKKEFDNIDVNQDGKIDENEFVEWWYKSNSRLQLKLADKFKFTAYSKGSGALG